MSYNENIVGVEQKIYLHSLIKDNPGVQQIQTPHDYYLSIKTEDGYIEIQSPIIFAIESNRGEIHYRVCTSHESGAQAEAYTSYFGFKIRNDGTFHILGKQRNKPAKFLKLYDHDEQDHTKASIIYERDCLRIVDKRTKPITTFQTKKTNTPDASLKEISILTQDYIEGIDGKKVLLEGFFNTLLEKDVINIFLDFCLMLKKLHDKNIVHADIKPKNLMISKNKGKLIDFGLSHKPRKHCMPGSILYMPPEIFNDRKWSKSGDIFSLALAFINMLDHGRPTNERKIKFKKSEVFYKLNLHNIKIDTAILKTANSTSPKKIMLFNLLKSMLNFEKNLRPTIDDCIFQLENINKSSQLYTNLSRIEKPIPETKRCCQFFSSSQSDTSKLGELLGKRELKDMQYQELLKLTKRCFSFIWFLFEKKPGKPNDILPENKETLIRTLKTISDLLKTNEITHAKINNDEPIEKIVSRIEGYVIPNSAPSAQYHRQ